MCQNSYSNGFFCFVYHVTSWTYKETQWYWQCKQVCETKHQSSESLSNVFIHVILVLLYSKKCFWLEQGTLARSAGWPNMHDCFSWFEGSNNYSAGVLQTSIAKNTSSITGRGIESQMLYVLQQSYLLCYSDHHTPCFLVPLCIGLRWCLNAVIIFLIYLSTHISTVRKHPK